MRKFSSVKAAAAAALVAAFAVAPAAEAGQFNTTSVQVWTGADNGVASSATASIFNLPTGNSTATFNYTGALDFVDNAPQNQNTSGNLFSSFFNLSDVTNFSSSVYSGVTAFGNASMSVAGNGIVSYIVFNTSYTSSTATEESILHDDGASVYIDGNASAVYSSPGETTADLGTFLLPAGTHDVTITYVEANGAPSDLVLQPVSEPAMLALFGGALLAMGIVHRRRI